MKPSGHESNVPFGIQSGRNRRLDFAADVLSGRAESTTASVDGLGTRLSFVLSGVGNGADEVLQARAADGSLLREDELRRQLARLLDDPRSYALCREFARQWLDLDAVFHLDQATIQDRQTINQKEDIPRYEAILQGHGVLEDFNQDDDKVDASRVVFAFGMSKRSRKMANEEKFQNDATFQCLVHRKGGSGDQLELGKHLIHEQCST
jgi:hypothetical protein